MRACIGLLLGLACVRCSESASSDGGDALTGRGKASPSIGAADGGTKNADGGDGGASTHAAGAGGDPGAGGSSTATAGAGGVAAFSWEEVESCPLPRFEAMGTVVGDTLFVMGGFISEKLDTTLRVHRYDLRTQQWDEASALPVASEHSGLALVGGRIILAGGLDPITDTVWSYDVAADTYSALPSLPAPTSAMALMLYDGTLHSIAGLGPDGDTDVNAHYTLELDADTAWSTVAGNIPNLRNHLGGAVIGDRLYIVGGRHGWDEAAGNQPTLSIFDPAEGKWKDGAPLPLARSEIAGATFEMKGKLIVVGGAVNPSKPSAQVFAYDPASDEWSELPALPGARKGAVAAAWGDSIVVSTGSPTGVDPIGTTWIGCCL